MRPTLPLDGHEVSVTTSIGIAFGTSGADRPEALLRDAEIAMYQVKEGGKNRYELFCPEMGELSSQRLTLEEDLRGPWNAGNSSCTTTPRSSSRPTRSSAWRL